MFLVLAAQYESLTLPLAVILIVPMCLIASITGVVLRGMDNNILTQVGFIVLIGLAAKNAILIVEFAKQLEDQGRDRYQAAAEAAELRLRPILMTSLAFILGVLPLAIAIGAGAELRQALGTAVVFGMMGVTIFGLIFTPTFYVVVRGSRTLSSAAAKPKLPPRIGKARPTDRHEIWCRSGADAQGGRCADPRRRALCRRCRGCRHWTCRGGAFAACPCALPDHRHRACQVHAGRARNPDRQRCHDTSNPLPCMVGVPGQKMIVPPCYVLARDEVYHVGDAVGFVVADTLDQARDAAEAIEIDWEPLPHVVGAEAALRRRRAAGLAGPAWQSRFRSQLRRPSRTE